MSNFFQRGHVIHEILQIADVYADFLTEKLFIELNRKFSHESNGKKTHF